MGVEAIVQRVNNKRLGANTFSYIIGYLLLVSASASFFGLPFPYYLRTNQDGKQYGEMEYFAWSVHNINEQDVAIGKWVAGNIPLEQKVAAVDVGAVGYFSRHTIVDICGLVSNDVMQIRKADPVQAEPHTLNFLSKVAKPGCVVMYGITSIPSWIGKLPYRTLYNVVAHNNLIGGGDTMTVMQMDWQHSVTTSVQDSNTSLSHTELNAAK